MKSARLSLLILAVVSLLTAAAHAGMDLLVSSPSTQSIRRYDSETGAFKGHFVAPGEGGLVQPRGMDVGQDGNLYVADGMVGRVKRFSMVDGSFIDDFTPTDILSPLKLRFSGEGDLFVMGGSSTQREIRCYSGINGAYLSTPVSGTTVTSGNLFDFIFMPGSQDFLTLGSLNRGSRFLSSSGQFDSFFLNPTGSTSILLNPRAVVVGTDGNYWVASRDLNRISRFDAGTGEKIDDLAVEGFLNGPAGLFLHDSQLFVANATSNDVIRYEITNPATAALGPPTVVVTAAQGLQAPEHLIVAEVDDSTAPGLPDIAQQAYLKASNPGTGDEFGRAVDLSGDTLVIGAPQEDSTATGGQSNNGAEDAGAVYVLIRENGAWVQQACLKAANAGAGDQFGTSVAIDGDTLVIGAREEASNSTSINSGATNNSAAAAGAAYVFVRNGGTWTQQAYLKASNAGAGDQFGWSVAVSGDTAVVGARYEDGGGTDSGAAYVFSRSGTTWTQQALLRASNDGAGDDFGVSVDIDGDTAIVGAHQEDGTATDAGAAYVFTRSGTTWSQQQILRATGGGAEDAFGAEVAISGESVVIRAALEDGSAATVNGPVNNSASAAGAAYVFTRSGTIWSQQAYLKPSNNTIGDQFGRSVDIEGDVVAVGSPFEDSAATGIDGNAADNSAADAGAAYIFTRTGTTWTQTAYLKASNTGAGDNFGISNTVRISGSRVLVGAPLEDGGAVGINGNPMDESLDAAGAAYLYDLDASPAELAVEAPAGNSIVDGTGVIDFGSVPVGHAGISRTVTLRNTGGMPLTGISASVQGGSPSDRVIVGNGAAILQPGHTTLVDLHVSTDLAGEISTQLLIGYDGDRGTPFTCALEAEGVASSVAPVQAIGILPSVATKAISDAPFSIATYATSGLPLTYSVMAGPATVSADGTVTLGGAEGSVTIRIRQDGGGGFDVVEEFLTFHVTQSGGFVNVSTGATHSAGIRKDGTLWAWGGNQFGQVGDGTFTERMRPVQIGNATDWTTVSCGRFHTVALRADGTLWTWGFNSNGQLGDGTTSDRAIPEQVGSLTNWSSISGGGNHTAALRSDGTLWAWGSNIAGQLGNGTTTDRTTPVQIGSTTTWTSVTCGGQHTVALRANGTLWAWGFNLNGQLGDGTTTQRSSPVQIGSATTWTSVAGGNFHTLALRANGTLWAWGYNVYSQLGDGTTTTRTSPVQIGSATTWTSVACSEFQSAALRGDGTLWTWGANSFGELGDGTAINRTVPAQVGTATDWSMVACAQNHTVALRVNGTLWAWGLPRLSGRGIGLVRLADPGVWVSMAGGNSHSVAVRADGTLWAWGNNADGRLGDGSTTPRTSPVLIGAGTTWAVVSCGNAHTAAVRTDGTLWAWGNNGSGQLGDGSTTQRTSPGQVGSATSWASVSCGTAHNAAVRTDGTLWAWGNNGNGRLGDGSTTQRTSPVQIGSATTWASVACGYDHTVGIRTDGTLWAWGSNQDGQLGDGTTTQRTTPVQIGTANDWSAVSGGRSLTAAVRTDGTLWVWGANGSGNPSNPTQVGSATTWSAVSCGSHHLLALQTDGTLWTRGSNVWGQLGDGTATHRFGLVRVGGSATWASIACGEQHTFGLRDDGSLWAWGQSSSGELAMADHSSSPGLVLPMRSPQSVEFPDPPPLFEGLPVTLAAIGTSGLPVSYRVLGPATLVGNQITRTGDGVIHIVAWQPGDDTWDVSEPAVHTRMAVETFSEIGLFAGPDDSSPEIDDAQAATIPFGETVAGGEATSRVFTVKNSGTAPLDLTGSPLVSLDGSPAFTVTQQPASNVAATGGMTTFEITFAPTTFGPHSAAVSIASDDADEDPFTFFITGTGQANPQPVTHLLVADGVSRSVLRLSADTGTSETFIDSTHFIGTPTCLVIGPERVLFVLETDWSNGNANRVLKFDALTGQLIGQFLPSGISRGSACVFDSEGNFYLLRDTSPFVVKFNSAGEPAGSLIFAGTYSPETAVGTALGLGIGPDSLLYLSVADSIGNTADIARFDLNGNYVDTFVNNVGNGNGYRHPRWDSQGNLWASNLNDGVLRKFDGTTGALLQTVDPPSNGYVGWSFLPDGNLVAGSVWTNTIYRVQADGTLLGNFATSVQAYSIIPQPPPPPPAPTPEITVIDGLEPSGIPLSNNQSSPVDFGSHPLPITGGVTRSFTVKNTGTAPLSIFSLAAAPLAAFEVLNSPPATLAPDATFTLAIRFSTNVAGTYPGSVSILSDSPDHPSFIFPITGEALDATPPVVQVSMSGGGSNPSYPSFLKSGSMIAINITANELIQQPEVLICGKSVATEESGGTWYGWIAVDETFPQGLVTLSMTATDLAGNTAEPVTTASSTYPLTVDTIAPAILSSWMSSDNPNPGWAKSGDTVYAGFTMSEEIPIAAFTVFGAPWMGTVMTGSGSISINSNPITSEPEGPVAISFQCVDRAGNSASFNPSFSPHVVVDRTPPVVTQSDLTAELTGSGGTAVAFSPTATDALGAIASVTSSPPSGSFFPAGLTSIAVNATDSAGNTGFGNFHLTMLAAGDFWRDSFFDQTSNSGDAADEADPDQDGLTNLIERAFNLHPLQAGRPILSSENSGLPRVTVQGEGEDRRLRVEYLRRKATSSPGLTYTAQFSSMLDQGWTAEEGEAVSSVNELWERVTVENVAGAGRSFGRVEVTSP